MIHMLICAAESTIFNAKQHNPTLDAGQEDLKLLSYV